MPLPTAVGGGRDGETEAEMASPAEPILIRPSNPC